MYDQVRLKRLRTAERILLPVGIVLGLGGAAYTYFASSSLWLSIFVFAMLSRFLIGGLPKIMFHGHKLKRMVFYLLWPAGGTAILYLVYSILQIMWLAVILGLIGGLFVSLFGGWIFFRKIAQEDQVRERKVTDFVADERLQKDAEALAMKERFASSEWDEIKRFPVFIFTMVALSDGKATKAELNAFADAVTKPKTCQDPLFRMMLLELNDSFARNIGAAGTVDQAATLLSNKKIAAELKAAQRSPAFTMDSLLDFSSGSGGERHPLKILERELNRDEMRSFLGSVVKYGLRIASADGKPTREQAEILFGLVGTVSKSKEDFLKSLGIDASQLNG